MMAETHDSEEWHHCSNVDVPDAVCDGSKLEYVVGGRLGGTHVDGCEGANVVAVIHGTHGVEMLNQRGEHLHTAINILGAAEELMELGGWKTASYYHHVGVKALDVGLLSWLGSDPVGNRDKPRVGFVEYNLCQEEWHCSILAVPGGEGD